LAFNNKLPDEIHRLVIRHKRMVKSCVNPGTHAENAQDRRKRDGTQTRYNAKTTPQQVEEIMASRGQGTKLERAKRFGVSLAIVRFIDRKYK